MKIWMLDCDVDKYENLCLDSLVLDEVKSFDGREKINDWKPVKVKRMYDRQFSNTPGFLPHIPVFDKKAIYILGDLLKGNAEILPLDCENGDFYVINVTKVLDCVDYEESSYKTFSDGKRIMRFTKYVFDSGKVAEHHLFKIRDERLKRPFVSDEFRKRVLESELSGFIFRLVWDSDEFSSKYSGRCDNIE